jgi:hypothetical protein
VSLIESQSHQPQKNEKFDDATFAKPLCSDNCGSKDETEKIILLLQGTLNNETAHALTDLINSLSGSGDGKTLLLGSTRRSIPLKLFLENHYGLAFSFDISVTTNSRMKSQSILRR